MPRMGDALERALDRAARALEAADEALAPLEVLTGVKGKGRGKVTGNQAHDAVDEAVKGKGK
eukprot:15935020-Heterocapsa_arctica.AAC.1